MQNKYISDVILEIQEVRDDILDAPFAQRQKFDQILEELIHRESDLHTRYIVTEHDRNPSR